MDHKEGLIISSLLKDINYELNNRLRCTFKHSEYTVPQITALQILYENEKMTLSELSNKMKLSNSTVSGIIDRLEKHGLVERIRSSEDKRIVYITLAAKSNFIEEHIQFHVNKYLGSLVEKASKEELQLILSGLQTLKELLKDNKEENV